MGPRGEGRTGGAPGGRVPPSAVVGVPLGWVRVAPAGLDLVPFPNGGGGGEGFGAAARGFGFACPLRCMAV